MKDADDALALLKLSHGFHARIVYAVHLIEVVKMSAAFPTLLRTFLRFADSRLDPARDVNRPKVIFVGFNKCGTKSLHDLFTQCGYLSCHSRTWWQKHVSGGHLALVMRSNQSSGARSFNGVQHYDAYSDLTYVSRTEAIEANTYFRRVAMDYPNAWFVFNDRPLQKWINSRFSHVGNARGSFAERYACARGVEIGQVADLWRDDYASHKADFVEFMNSHPKSMIFDIENDSIDKLVSFLAPAFRLRPENWKKKGSQSERFRRYNIGNKGSSTPLAIDTVG